MERLTVEVQSVFRELVMQGDWLSAETKDLADAKIRNIVHSIGYPDAILDELELQVIIQTVILASSDVRQTAPFQKEIEGLTYADDKFFENVLMNLRKRAKEEMAIVDQAVNRTQWTATPADVNAYYSRNRNQISEFFAAQSRRSGRSVTSLKHAPCFQCFLRGYYSRLSTTNTFQSLLTMGESEW